ncbi:MAG: FeoA family protein [Aeromonadaceae bacterium]
MQLSDIQPGQSARILSLGALDASVRRKLMAMGLLPCSEVRYLRCAPMGDPLQITTGGITLSVQKQLAKLIEVERL